MGTAQPTEEAEDEAPTPHDYQLALRETQVVKLRLEGLEFDAIAEQVGYANRSGAWKAWKRAIARMPITETRHERAEVVMRLNVAVKGIWSKVEKGDLFAIDRLVALEKLRADLLNLAIPPKAPDPTPTTIIFQTNFEMDAL